MQASGDDHYTVVLQPAALEFAAPAGISLLAAAAQAGIALPASCRNGTCRACLCRLVSGQVGYLIEWPGLSAEEKKEGYTLPCVAHPLSDLVLHVPGVRRLERA